METSSLRQSTPAMPGKGEIMRANDSKQGQHKHEFTKGQRSNILVCACGKFQHPPGTVGIEGIEKGQQATARPWKVDKCSGMIINKEQLIVLAPERLLSDSELIIRAVNGHDALVEALESAIGLIEDMQDNEGYPQVPTHIKAALKAARGDA